MSWTGFPLAEGDANTDEAINQVIDAVRERQWACGLSLLSRVSSGDPPTYSLFNTVQTAITSLLTSAEWVDPDSWDETTRPTRYVTWTPGTGEANIFTEAFGSGTTWRETIGIGHPITAAILNDWRLVLNKLVMVARPRSLVCNQMRERNSSIAYATCSGAVGACDSQPWAYMSQYWTNVSWSITGGYIVSRGPDALPTHYSAAVWGSTAIARHIVTTWSVSTPAAISGVSVNAIRIVSGISNIDWDNYVEDAYGPIGTYAPNRSATLEMRVHSSYPMSWSEAFTIGDQMDSWSISSASGEVRCAEVAVSMAPGATKYFSCNFSGLDTCNGAGLCSYLTVENLNAYERLVAYHMDNWDWVEFAFAFAP